MKQLVIVFLLVVLATGCNEQKKTEPGKRWALKDQEDFRQSCVENAKSGIGEEKAKKYCECMLEKVMKKYPDVNDTEKMTMGETVELAKECSQ